MEKTLENILKRNILIKDIENCKELIKNKLFKYIKEGVQGKIFKIMSPKCGTAIVKVAKEIDGKIPLWISNKFETEIKVMLLLKRLIDKNICPNFIKIYDYDKEKSYILMDYCDGDSHHLFLNNKLEIKIYESYICQVILTYAYFNKYTLLNHRDMKPNNILFKKTDKNLVLNYNIDNKNFIIPTYGYMFLLADFGNAKFYSTENHPDDFEYFKYKMTKLVNNIIDNQNIKNFINENINILNSNNFLDIVYEIANKLKLPTEAIQINLNKFEDII